MEFKLKDKVKLVDNDTVLLRRLLRGKLAYNANHFASNMLRELTDDKYHELCHQCYLFQVEDFYWNCPFTVDDGEVHDKKGEEDFKTFTEIFYPSDPSMYTKNLMEHRKEKLINVLLSSRRGWDVYCSTMDALKALEKDNNDD